MTNTAVLPGSFDPITLGHLDVILRAAALFDELHLVVSHNPDKSGFLSIDERLALVSAVVAEAGIEQGVTVARLDGGLIVDYCSNVGAQVLVKGLRSQADLAYEAPMALVNRNLARVETVFLLPDPANAYVSSSLVRQVASLGGDVAPYVPPAVLRFLAGQALDGSAEA